MKTEFTAMLLVLAAMLTLSSAGSPYGRCNPPSGMYPFDANKFAGDWFEVGFACTGARCEVDASSEANTTCSRATYRVTHDANRTTTTLVFDDKVEGTADFQRLGTWVGVPFYPGNDSVVRAVHLDAGGDLIADVAAQTVVATDYTNHAVFYLCRHFYVDESDSLDVMEVWLVWSRTGQVDDKLREFMDSVKARLGVPETSFEESNSEGC